MWGLLILSNLMTLFFSQLKFDPFTTQFIIERITHPFRAFRHTLFADRMKPYEEDYTAFY